MICCSVREPGQTLQGVDGSHRVHEREAEQALGDHGVQDQADEIGFGGRNQEHVLQGVLDLGGQAHEG